MFQYTVKSTTFTTVCINLMAKINQKLYLVNKTSIAMFTNQNMSNQSQTHTESIICITVLCVNGTLNMVIILTLDIIIKTRK